MGSAGCRSLGRSLELMSQSWPTKWALCAAGLIALAGEMNPKSYEHLVYPQYAGRGSGDLWNAASWRADIVFSVFLDSKKKRKDTSAIKEHK